MARHKHIGEFLKDIGSPNEEILKSWGEDLFNTSEELIKGFNQINNKSKEEKANF